PAARNHECPGNPARLQPQNAVAGVDRLLQAGAGDHSMFRPEAQRTGERATMIPAGSPTARADGENRSRFAVRNNSRRRFRPELDEIQPVSPSSCGTSRRDLREAKLT